MIAMQLTYHTKPTNKNVNISTKCRRIKNDLGEGDNSYLFNDTKQNNPSDLHPKT